MTLLIRLAGPGGRLAIAARRLVRKVDSGQLEGGVRRTGQLDPDRGQPSRGRERGDPQTRSRQHPVTSGVFDPQPDGGGPDRCSQAKHRRLAVVRSAWISLSVEETHDLSRRRRYGANLAIPACGTVAKPVKAPPAQSDTPGPRARE